MPSKYPHEYPPHNFHCRDCGAGQESHNCPTKLLARIGVLCDEIEELRAQAAKRANECQRIYYNASAQQDQICREPRGHEPDPPRCRGEPDEDSEGGAGRG